MSIRKLLCISFFIVFLCLPPISPAQGFRNFRSYYQYHPMSTLSLGAGFSPNDLSVPKRRALEFTPEPAEPGTLTTSLSTLLVRNSSQLKEALNLDIGIDGSFLAFKGGAKFSYDQRSIFNADSLTLVISATSEFGRIMMKNAVLNKEAAELVNTNKMAEFEERYGSQVVMIERRGSSIFVLLTISDVSLDAKQKVFASMEASGGWGPLSASAKTHFLTELERASKLGQINVQVLATGGEGFAGLADMVKTLAGSKDDALKNIQDTLSVYLKGFNTKNSVPIGFHTASMRNFGWNPNKIDVWTDNQERILFNIVERYRTIKTKLERITLLLDPGDPRHSLLKPENIKQLKEAIPTYERYLSQLADDHSRVKGGSLGGIGKPYNMPEDPLENIQLAPPLPAPPRVSYRVFLDEQRQDLGKSAAMLDEINRSLILGTPAEKELTDKYKVKNIRQVFFIEGEYLSGLALYFDGVLINEHKIDDKTKATDFDVTRLHLGDETLKLEQDAKYLKPGSIERSDFEIRVTDAFGQSVKYKLPKEMWIYYTFG